MDMESVHQCNASKLPFEASDIPTGSKALRTSWRVLLHAARVWTRSTPGGLGDLSRFVMMFVNNSSVVLLTR